MPKSTTKGPQNMLLACATSGPTHPQSLPWGSGYGRYIHRCIGVTSLLSSPRTAFRVLPWIPSQPITKSASTTVLFANSRVALSSPFTFETSRPYLIVPRRQNTRKLLNKISSMVRRLTLPRDSRDSLPFMLATTSVRNVHKTIRPRSSNT